MKTILLSIILLIGLAFLYFQIKNRFKQEVNVNEKLKDELNYIKTTFNAFFGNIEKKNVS